MFQNVLFIFLFSDHGHLLLASSPNVCFAKRKIDLLNRTLLFKSANFYPKPI